MSQGQSQGGGRGIIIALLVVIVVLLAAVAGVGLLLVQSLREEPNVAVATATPEGVEEEPSGPQDEPSAAEEESPSQEPSPQPSPTRQPALNIPPVPSSDPEFDLSLDSISGGRNNVIAGFSLIRNDYGCTTPEMTTSDLVGSYLIDDATNQQYQVVTNANGEPLVNGRLGEISLCSLDERVGFTVQFSAPPPGSTVTVVLPIGQPFVNVTLP